jgi:hypothetical protein
MGQTPAGVTELYEVGRTSRASAYHTLEFDARCVRDQRDRDDAVAIARGFGGQSGLEREIRTLDFESARARLDALA